MSKMTKAQQKRALNAIRNKAVKVWSQPQTNFGRALTFKDIEAIEKIVARAMKRLG